MELTGGKLKVTGFPAWVLWLAVHLVYIIGFKSRVTTLLHWLVSFLGRGRSERNITEQQIFGRIAMNRVGNIPERAGRNVGWLADEADEDEPREAPAG